MVEPDLLTSPVVLATANPHKVAELRAIFAQAGIEVVGLADLPGGPGRFHEPDEHGTTFDDNAAIKALAYAAQTGRVCVADDSGLEIDALHGRPGVISSHYSTEGRETGLSRTERDAANNDRVIRELEGVVPENRTARFVCSMALASPPQDLVAGRLLHRTLGTFEGRIGVPPRVPAGTNGFGYDPLFLVGPSFHQTGAELTADEKNRLSHRARAAAAMARWISVHKTRS